MKREVFGATPDGDQVERIGISGGGLAANILSFGAVVQDLRFERHISPLVLGFETFDPYLTHSPYFGACVGRCANRIANGRFELDGNSYQLDQNEAGRHTLHGGSAGISQRNWTFTDIHESSVTLALTDTDGTMGFPGTVQHTCTYSLLEDGVLSVTLTATTDAPTIVNVAHHSYFTLDGANDCRNTHLQIKADAYLPLDSDLIPTGKIAPVERTPFDFRKPKPIGRELKPGLVYDHNFCLATKRTKLREVAFAFDPDTRLSLAIATTEPGLQLYCADALSIPVPGLAGKNYGPFAGFALETQIWPDAINQAEFPNVVLRPGEASEQITHYRFGHVS